MKYAVFSDVHGNIYAFEAMMNALRCESIEGYLFCGDLTGYYYHAKKIIEEVRQLPNFIAVRGNHDELYLRALDDSSVQCRAVQKFGSSYASLDEETAQYIRTLPATLTMDIGNFRLVMLHGSPLSPLSGRIYPDSILDIPQLEFDFLFVGHTHYQMRRLHENNCKIVNPGSLGQPRDGKGFSYYIVDFLTGEVDCRRVDFDLSPLFGEIAERDSCALYLSDVLKRNRRL